MSILRRIRWGRVSLAALSIAALVAYLDMDLTAMKETVRLYSTRSWSGQTLGELGEPLPPGDGGQAVDLQGLLE